MNLVRMPDGTLVTQPDLIPRAERKQDDSWVYIVDDKLRCIRDTTNEFKVPMTTVEEHAHREWNYGFAFGFTAGFVISIAVFGLLVLKGAL